MWDFASDVFLGLDVVNYYGISTRASVYLYYKQQESQPLIIVNTTVLLNSTTSFLVDDILLPCFDALPLNKL